MFSHKKGSITDPETSAVVEELIYMDTRLGSSYHKIHLMSFIGTLQVLAPRAQLHLETLHFKWHLYFIFSCLIPKGHHTSVKFGNVSKTTDYPEISWSSHNLLVLDANPQCNYAFGVFLFCFDYNNLCTIHRFLKKVFLLIYVLIRIEGWTILQKNQVVP